MEGGRADNRIWSSHPVSSSRSFRLYQFLFFLISRDGWAQMLFLTHPGPMSSYSHITADSVIITYFGVGKHRLPCFRPHRPTSPLHHDPKPSSPTTDTLTNCSPEVRTRPCSHLPCLAGALSPRRRPTRRLPHHRARAIRHPASDPPQHHDARATISRPRAVCGHRASRRGPTPGNIRRGRRAPGLAAAHRQHCRAVPDAQDDPVLQLNLEDGVCRHGSLSNLHDPLPPILVTRSSLLFAVRSWPCEKDSLLLADDILVEDMLILQDWNTTSSQISSPGGLTLYCVLASVRVLVAGEVD